MRQKFINPLTATTFQEFNKLAYCIILVINNLMCSKNTQLTESKKQRLFWSRTVRFPNLIE